MCASCHDVVRISYRSFAAQGTKAVHIFIVLSAAVCHGQTPTIYPTYIQGHGHMSFIFVSACQWQTAVVTQWKRCTASGGQQRTCRRSSLHLGMMHMWNVVHMCIIVQLYHDTKDMLLRSKLLSQSGKSMSNVSTQDHEASKATEEFACLMQDGSYDQTKGIMAETSL